MTWFFFFFSSRRRHTRFSRDWSSDVCSSDLDWVDALPDGSRTRVGQGAAVLSPAQAQQLALARLVLADPHTLVLRSEERRVGKECRTRSSAYHYKNKPAQPD